MKYKQSYVRKVVKKVEMKKEEQMIYIKDLFFVALYRWKAVVVAALVLGLLLGGYKAMDALKPQPVQTENAEALAEYESQKAAMEQRIATLQKTVDDRQNYLKNSLLMQLDPYHHYETRVTAFADTGFRVQPGASYQDPDRTHAVLAAYESALLNQSVLEKIGQIVGVSEQYAIELIRIERNSSNGISEGMTVKVKCDTAEKAALLETALVEILQENSADIGESVAKHTLTIPEKTSSATVDLTLVDTQKKEVNGIAEMLNGLADAKTKRAALVAPAGGTGISRSAQLKKAAIFAVLGAAAGAFFVVCLAWGLHIISTKVYSVRTLQNRTGIKVVGCICTEPAKCRLNRWLRKLEGRCTETGVELNVTDISLRVQKGDKVLLTGSVESQTRQVLAKALAEAGVQVSEVADLRSCPKSLEALAEADAVVLVEQCGASSYEAVVRQMEIIADYNKQLIGCVVLDG